MARLPAKKRKHPADTNRLAKSIVDQATGLESAESPADQNKSPAAIARGRLGGLKGGKARAVKLSPAKRKSIAKKAAKARWERA